MSAPGPPLSFLQPKKKKDPPKLVKRVETIVVKRAIPSVAVVPSRPVKAAPKSHLHGSARKASSSPGLHTPTSSRPSSKEPVERVRTEQTRAKSNKRSSPSAARLSSEDEDDDPQPKKRSRIEQVIDPTRQIRDLEAFDKDRFIRSQRVHAYDIANSTLVQSNRTSYETFFTDLSQDEDVDPIVKVEYPGGAVDLERFQILKPVDHSDFQPIAEILENMKIVSEYYLDTPNALKLFNINGSGMYQALDRARKAGDKHTVGAQTQFTDKISEYNKFIQGRRNDGTIANAIDRMRTIPLPVLKRIIEGEVYSRTVSPNVNTLRQYEGFSDNVYGELKPEFLSRIFKETGLRSDQIFVDLGSGVGNCVMQAALETGCTAWGCEMMNNPAELAVLASQEFKTRCKLWGLKPGLIHLIHDDFLENLVIAEVMKKADVILINNQAFNSPLNDTIKHKLLDCKEGAQIVSLKYFRDPQHRIKVTNLNDPINVLRVQEKDRYRNMVSWSDDPGKWYLHTKDSSELKRFNRSLQEAKMHLLRDE